MTTNTAIFTAAGGIIGTVIAAAISLALLIANQGDRIERRIDQLDGRIDQLDGRMSQLEGRMGQLEGRVGQIDGRMGQLEGRMSQLEGRMVAVEKAQAHTAGLLEGLGLPQRLATVPVHPLPPAPGTDRPNPSRRPPD